MSRQILIIPDVHGRTFWKKPVKDIDKYEKVIFLGDYLDPYPSEGISEEEAIEVLKEIIELKKSNPDKVVLLLGNHDVHYLWYKEANFCTRFSFKNLKPIMNLFFENQKLFKLTHDEAIGPKVFLFSHAGITNAWLTANNYQLNVLGASDYLNKLSKTEDGRRNLSQIGKSRNGANPSGGPVWADYYFDMHNGDENVDEYIYQIVGHTRSFNERRIGPHAACLDCKKAWVLDCLSGKLEVVV